MGDYQGAFDKYQPLKGRGWLRLLSDEDRKVFGELGWSEAAAKGINVPSMGGKARAESAQRVPKGNGRLSGRFVKESSNE